MELKLTVFRRAAALCLLALAAPGHAQPAVREGRLTTPAGLTLYTSGNDVVGSGKSACYPPCSNLHPPYLVEQGINAGEDFSFLERSDGAKQWTYKGKPLYLWIYDQKPGEAGADGMNRGVWKVAQP